MQAQAARLSDTAALFQALGGGWWNRIEPPAPEQRLNVASGLTQSVADDGNWFTTIFSNVRWRGAAAAPPVNVAKPQVGPLTPQQATALSAPPPSKPPPDDGKWDVTRLFGRSGSRTTRVAEKPANKGSQRGRTHVRTALLTGAALAALSLPAGAGILDPAPAYPVATPPTFAPIHDWTGFYAGLSGGATRGSAKWESDLDLTQGTVSGSSGLIGGGIGYNSQTLGRFVLGEEFDSTRPYNFTIPAVTCMPNCTLTSSWVSTARLRFGYSVGTFMPYVTGGLSMSDFQAAPPPNRSAPTTTSPSTGWWASASNSSSQARGPARPSTCSSITPALFATPSATAPSISASARTSSASGSTIASAGGEVRRNPDDLVS